MPFRKYLNATDQPLLGTGPAGLDANGGTFVASPRPLEGPTEASACSSGRDVSWVICGEKSRKIMENMSACGQNASSPGAIRRSGDEKYGDDDNATGRGWQFACPPRKRFHERAQNSISICLRLTAPKLTHATDGWS